MPLLIAVTDCCGTRLEARCSQADPHSGLWRVQFWGPKGLRYSTPIALRQGDALEQALQRYVDEHHLCAVAGMSPSMKLPPTP
jgi:hypothetical protein